MGTPKSRNSQAKLSKYRFSSGSDGPKMAPAHKTAHEEDMEDDEISLPASEDSARGKVTVDHPLTFADMTEIAADIKNSLSAAITDLKTDLLRLTEQMAVNERAGTRRERALIRLDDITASHSQHMIEMNRQIEDLDNRGRRHNIRVRGVPESVTPEQIKPALSSIFNNLIERPEASPIEFNRAHRALRPRAPDNTPPRDIICCLPNICLKEEILQKARMNELITFNGTDVQLFQDLSPISLKNRRALKPLLGVLREKGINYRWKFPALQASYNSKQFMLRVPDDLLHFCENLQIAPVELPDWYAEFRLPPAINNMPSTSGLSPEKSPFQYGKQRRNTGRLVYNSPATKSPRSRDARQNSHL